MVTNAVKQASHAVTPSLVFVGFAVFVLVLNSNDHSAGLWQISTETFFTPLGEWRALSDKPIVILLPSSRFAPSASASSPRVRE